MLVTPGSLFSSRRNIPKRGIALPDLVQLALMGLDKTLERYKPERGKFSTYAAWWIRSAIEEAIRAHPGSHPMAIPAHRKSLYTKIRRADERLKPGGGADDGELLDCLLTTTELFVKRSKDKPEGWRREEIARWIWEYRVEWRIVASLDTPVGKGDDSKPRTVMDFIPGRQPDPETNAWLSEAPEIKKTVLGVVAQLSKVESTVLTMRFGLDGTEPMTLQQIGKQLGVSRERIRQRQEKGLAQMTKPLGVPSSETERIVDILSAVGEMVSGETRGRRVG